ncbi:LuxR C-terminal-related transcriptional regulator [Streptomyces sp. NPDC048717]|uniref:LuxR C-terminal-related transcriptional regulator n=1 Tax=Streptomyces sp. NPDC048717 TaxID=3154928 RepID=UPI0034290A10
MNTSAHPPLTSAQKRVGTYLVQGLGNQEIAQKMGLAPSTVGGHIRNSGRRLGCPSGSPRAVIAHRLLAHRQVPPPPLPTHSRAFKASEDDRELISAHTTHVLLRDIAAAALIPPADYRKRVTDLLHRAGAINPVHLVGLAHTLNILGSNTPTAAQVPKRTEAAR